ncbi:MAG: hypothetical protein V1257_09155 [Candidatus Neomarinimicrobiota bacterium]|jgi:uncharacterized membrane protein|nr:hypothetical protein [Candidatus Neomarinimicrobiota bacterium]MEE1573741.1 hypothetical protein [Candidatus Neomarinimicrobiota bacterium]|tara:strand:+ start:117 stop:404 length:288 start_codon:yes stop_codon:yes gene_type:complete
MLPFERTWLPYLYLYGAGGLIFMTGIFLILKSKALNRVHKKHRYWLKVLILGFIWYMAIHGLLSLAAVGILPIGLVFTILFISAVSITIFLMRAI